MRRVLVDLAKNTSIATAHLITTNTHKKASREHFINAVLL
jgi:hypothetical protein